MTEKEVKEIVRAVCMLADYKTIILGKCVRVIENEINTKRAELTFQSVERQNMFGDFLNVLESTIKDELKKMEV